LADQAEQRLAQLCMVVLQGACKTLHHFCLHLLPTHGSGSNHSKSNQLQEQEQRQLLLLHEQTIQTAKLQALTAC